MTSEKPYYTINELAVEINRSRKTIESWIKNGKLKSDRYGAQHRITKENWEEAHANFNRKPSAVN